jgi:HEAT repeat protein
MTDVLTWAANLFSDDSAVRLAAAQRLSRLGEAARPAAAPLVRAVADPDEEVAEFATAALEELGPPDPADVAALDELASHANADVAWWAVTLLGRLGPSATAAVPTLTTLVRSSPEMQVRQRAVWSLGRIGDASEPVRITLREAAASSDPRLSRLAREALEQLGAS